METKKKIFITQNIAESMWSKYISEKKKVTIIPKVVEGLNELVDEARLEDVELVNIIDNKALLNEINNRSGLSLDLNTSDLKAEISDEENCHVIYSISVSNLKNLYSYAKEESLPSGVNLRVIRYEIS